MQVTEEEAKTKICPFSRVFEANMTFEEDRGLDEAPRKIKHVQPTCLGSKCMAWEFVSPLTLGVIQNTNAFGYEIMRLQALGHKLVPDMGERKERTEEEMIEAGWRKGDYRYQWVRDNPEPLGGCSRAIYVQNGE